MGQTTHYWPESLVNLFVCVGCLEKRQPALKVAAEILTQSGIVLGQKEWRGASPRNYIISGAARFIVFQERDKNHKFGN